MIFKFQRSLDGKKILVYNKDRKVLGEFDYEEQHEAIFNGRRKMFIKGKVDRRGMIQVKTIVSDRDW